MGGKLLFEPQSRLTPDSTKDYELILVGKARAASLNRLWHRTRPEIGAVNSFKVCHGAAYQGEIFAVAIWSNPVARVLPQRRWLELRRFAIAPDAKRNLATRMMKLMVEDIRSRLPGVQRLITYQDHEEHAGTIYKAMSNWIPFECGTRGGAWGNRERWNRTAKRCKVKTRWELELKG